MFTDFRERGRDNERDTEREEERERNIDLREKHGSVAYCMQRARRLAWPGINSATFWFTGRFPPPPSPARPPAPSHTGQASAYMFFG